MEEERGTERRTGDRKKGWSVPLPLRTSCHWPTATRGPVLMCTIKLHPFFSSSLSLSLSLLWRRDAGPGGEKRVSRTGNFVFISPANSVCQCLKGPARKIDARSSIFRMQRNYGQYRESEFHESGLLKTMLGYCSNALSLFSLT